MTFNCDHTVRTKAASQYAICGPPAPRFITSETLVLIEPVKLDRLVL